MMDLSEVVLRLSTASLIGAACGLNRNLHRKPTGVRTLGLVGFGSAFIVITFGQASTADASRVVQGVSSRELGSLARGGIVRNDNHCRVPCAWHYNCSMRLAHSVHRGSMRGCRVALSPHKPANRAGAFGQFLFPRRLIDILLRAEPALALKWVDASCNIAMKAASASSRHSVGQQREPLSDFRLSHRIRQMSPIATKRLYDRRCGARIRSTEITIG